MRNSVLSHHRAYRSVHGGSINLTSNTPFGVVVQHGDQPKVRQSFVTYGLAYIRCSTDSCKSFCIRCPSRCPRWHSQFYEISRPILGCFPMFPNAHSQAVSDVPIQSHAQPLHAPDFEVIFPSSDELVQLLHLIGVAYSPASACQFLHLRFELRYCFRVWSGLVSFGE